MSLVPIMGAVGFLAFAWVMVTLIKSLRDLAPPPLFCHECGEPMVRVMPDAVMLDEFGSPISPPGAKWVCIECNKYYGSPAGKPATLEELDP
jgi:hypothetical protein